MDRISPKDSNYPVVEGVSVPISQPTIRRIVICPDGGVEGRFCCYEFPGTLRHVEYYGHCQE